jgi:hypothetical protein
VLEHFNDFADPWVQELPDDPPTGGRLRSFEAGWERRGTSLA